MTVRTAVLVSALGLAASPAPAAEDFPDKPLRLVVPFPPGTAVKITPQ